MREVHNRSGKGRGGFQNQERTAQATDLQKLLECTVLLILLQSFQSVRLICTIVRVHLEEISLSISGAG
jgi:hypothetical protein